LPDAVTRFSDYSNDIAHMYSILLPSCYTVATEKAKMCFNLCHIRCNDSAVCVVLFAEAHSANLHLAILWNTISRHLTLLHASQQIIICTSETQQLPTLICCKLLHTCMF